MLIYATRKKIIKDPIRINIFLENIFIKIKLR